MSDRAKLNPKDFEIKGAYQPPKKAAAAPSTLSKLAGKASEAFGSLTGRTQAKKAGDAMQSAGYRLKMGD